MGIWLIYYGISSAHRADYLHWFEGQHIDEKLARPGYDWASHYEVTPAGVPDTADHAYIAIFGAESSRVFFDPSPAQIKPNQDELTRNMIAHRVKPIPAILTQEWCEYPTAKQQTKMQSTVSSEYIRMGIFAEKGDDQEIVSWCAQSHFPKLANSEQVSVVRKCLASFGTNRHIILEEHTGEVVSNGAWLNQPKENLACDPVVAKLRVFRQ